MSVGAHVAFCRAELVLSDGRRLGDALAADPWVERELLEPVFAVDEAGLPVHRLVYLELPRGHWKSGGAAGIALALVSLGDESTDVVIVAGDTDQGRIVLENIDGFVARNPLLEGLVYARGDERIVRDTGSRIRVIGSDAPTAWGLGGTHRRFRLIADEATVWRGGEDLWTALVSATGKVEDAQTIVLSNAGFDPSDRSWQWRLRRTAEREPWAHLFSARGVIASWITPRWIEEMRALLPPPAFERVILNRWVSGAGDFVTAEQWAACVDLSLRPTPNRRPEFFRGWHVAGLDLGLTKDRTAMTVVHRDGARVVLDQVRVWQGTKLEPVSIAAVERALVEAAELFRPLRIVADPWQFHGSIQRLRAAGLMIEEFSFGSASVQRLSQTLYHAVTTAGLRVFEDPALEAEVLGLVVRETAGGWRIDHRAGGYSDRAIALAMAVQEALKLPGHVSSFVERTPERIWTEDGYVYDGLSTGGFMERPM